MIMVYVVQTKDGKELHAEPVRSHTLMSEAMHTKANHERSMTRTPGVPDREGIVWTVEIRQE